MPTHDTESTSDPSRYDSAAGWQPKPAKTPKHYQKQKERIAREWEERSAHGMFDPRTANACVRSVKKKELHRKPLFLDLWHTGELAVLCGPAGSGKSTLATQIAETIARGRVGAHSLTTDSRQPTTSQKVLLLDLENSDLQFARRYTCEIPWTGRIAKYRFSDNLERPEIDDEFVPEVFRDRPAEYLSHSVGRIVDECGVRVLIIDNLTLLEPSVSIDKLALLMRRLRMYARNAGLSILVTYPIPERSLTASAKPFQIPRSAFRILAPADSAFAILPTTWHQDHRYVKAIKSPPPCLGGVAEGRGGSSADSSIPRSASPDDVYVFKLARSQGPSSSSPPCLGGVAEGRGGSSEEIALTTDHRPQATPFLGLQFLGPSPEHYHYEDHTERHLHPREKKTLSKKDQIVEMILDPAYGRYLRGEK